MRLLPVVVPREHAATAQAIHSALVGGLFLGGGLWLAGHAWHTMGSNAFLLMMLPAAVGLALAWRLGRPAPEATAVSPPL